MGKVPFLSMDFKYTWREETNYLENGDLDVCAVVQKRHKVTMRPKKAPGALPSRWASALENGLP